MLTPFKSKMFVRQFRGILLIVLFTYVTISAALLTVADQSLKGQQLIMAESYRKVTIDTIYRWLTEIRINLRTKARYLELLSENNTPEKTLDIFEKQLAKEEFLYSLVITDKLGPVIDTRTENNDLGMSMVRQSIVLEEPMRFFNGAKYKLKANVSLASFGQIVKSLNLENLWQVYFVKPNGDIYPVYFNQDYPGLKGLAKSSGGAFKSYALKKVLQHQEGKGIYPNFYGHLVLGSYQWLKPLRIGLIVELRLSKAIKPTMDLFRVISILAGLIIILGAGVAYYLSRNITGPINLLIDAATNIEKCNYQEPLSIKTNTELDLLVEQFNRMQAAIEARERELHYRNQELKSQKAEAIEANKLKSYFLANMSHELRTPLNSIIGFTNRVIKKSSEILPDIQLDNLAIVKNEAEHLLELINDLLDVSKIEAGKMEIHLETFDLVNVVKEAETVTHPLLESKSLSLKQIGCDKVLPIHSDRLKIKQIMINLLSNALKYSEKGTVIISVHDDGPSYRIIVADEGIGIEAEYLKEIFDEFRQIDDSYTRKVGGTGLGLSITKKFLEMLRGDIEVQSKIGEGSQFTVYLPKHYEEELPLVKTAISQDVQSGNSIVVCIDDDYNVCRLYKQYLEECHYTVKILDGREDVVAEVATIQPDVVVLDIILPQKDGWEILDELKRNEGTRNIPVIIASILSESELAYKLNADEYLIKPITAEELIDTIGRVVTKKNEAC